MTILSPQVLENVLDLVESGASVVETTAAIGAAPKSKIIFTWIKASEDAGEFDPPPDASCPWCIVWHDKLDFFHLHYREAVESGRITRSMRVSPIRRDLEERLAAKRAMRPAAVAPTLIEQRAPAKTIIEHAIERTMMVDTAPPPPPPKPRPSYAYRAPTIEGTHRDQGPPLEGRFSMVADRPRSQRERQAGLPEITDLGVRIN